MSNEKFRVKFGLQVGDTTADINATTGDITTIGDINVNGGDVKTTASSASLFNDANALTVSMGGSATTVSIGANTGTTTINNSLVADDISVLTVDTTNLEVTNIKAKDGTAAMTIQDSTGAVNVSSSLQVDNIDIRINTISATDTNGSINLTPNGTGSVRANGPLDVGTIRALDGTAAATIANSTGVVTVSTELNVDNLNISGNTISSTNTNGDITITPNGTGDVDLVADTVQVGDSNATATITTNGTGNLVLNTNNGTNAGNITLTQGTNGNITLTPNGTGKVVVTDNSTVLGGLLATTNLNYTFPGLPLTSISGNNGLDAASSMPDSASTLGNGAQQQIAQYFGDTFAGPLTTAVLSLKSAFGNSATSGTVPFTGVAVTAPSGLISTAALGTINYNGYATTGFTDYIGTRNQGGGFNGLHATQVQSFALETFADGTLTISGATITNVTRTSTTLSSVTITGTRGQISFTATTPSVGQAVNVTGTLTGTGTGITAGTYYIVAVASTTSCTLSATPGGPPLTTTAGTLTGLTLARRFITVTYSAQTNIPFGTNALITIANITGVTNGTYMAVGTSTTTSVLIGVDTAAVSLPGTQSLSIATVTNCGTGFRVRAFPTATTMNAGNRLELIDHRASAATYRADTFTISGGAYGNTSTARVTVDSSKVTMALPVAFPSYTRAALNAITGAVGWQAAVSDSAAGNGVVNGAMAFWDTTNARWSYISNNLAL